MPVRTRGDVLRFAIAFALMRARKLVRGLRQGLSEDERFLIADAWRLSEELPNLTGKGHSTPPMDKT